MIFYKHGKGASSFHVSIAIGMDSVSVMYVLQDVLVPVRFFFRKYAQIQRKIALLHYFDHNLT
jgi:hypothetical protein